MNCGQKALIASLEQRGITTVSLEELANIERKCGMVIGRQRTDAELIHILEKLGNRRGFKIGLIVIDSISFDPKANSSFNKSSFDANDYIVISHTGDASSGHYEPVLDVSIIATQNIISKQLLQDAAQSAENQEDQALAMAMSDSLAYEECPPPEDDLALAMAMLKSLEEKPEEFHTLDEELALAIAISLSLQSA